MEKLTEEGDALKEHTAPAYGSGIMIPKENWNHFQEWLIRCENIIFMIFGEKSVQYHRFKKIRESDNKAYDIYNQLRGLMRGCFKDVRDGFLTNQEFIIANEIFDSILEEAEEFIKQKKKDIGAILLRIVLEDSIRRIAKREGINNIDNITTSEVNDKLKNSDFFSKTIWRQNQVWLDIGNYASHGDFDKYTQDEVEKFHNGLTNFIITYFN